MTIRKFDNRHAPVLRYDCDGDLLDRSDGPSETLTAPGAVFRHVYGDTLGLSAIVASRTVTDVELEQYGDITVLGIGVLRTVPSSHFAVAFQAPGESEATNYLWGLQLASQNQMAYLHEHSAAALNDTFYSNSPLGLPALGVPFFFGLRRRNGVVSFLLRGETYGDPSPVLPPPTGGTLDTLTLNSPGSTPIDFIALQVIPSALSDGDIRAVYNDCFQDAPEFAQLEQSVTELWVGALGTTTASVVVQLGRSSNAIRLAVSNGTTVTFTTERATADHSKVLRFDLSGLSADTPYEYWVEEDGAQVEGSPVGHFRTAPSGACSFKVAFSGDAETNSNAVVFDRIREQAPLVFLHLGDAHYENIATNSPALFRAAYDHLFAQPRQAQLYRDVPTVYVFDDHDRGANNSDGSSPSRDASCQVYRERVPHYPLVETASNGSVYHSFDIGRVRFLVTDQRSAASPDSAVDNASKSLLGTAQKAWLKAQLASSPGRLLVWVCPRVFGWTAALSNDSWGSFSTERREIADFIKANCHGRVVVFSADMHGVGIDNGSNHDFATGGGEPLKTFQASPLAIAAPGVAGTYSEGTSALNGQFGTMEVTDTGGPSLDVTWKAWDDADHALLSYSFSVTV
jgi:PhoD-like phosphatase